MECLAFGCSHTENRLLPKEQRWMYMVQERTGLDFLNCGAGATGIIHIITDIHKNDYKKWPEADPSRLPFNCSEVEWLVIQKPESCRYPWKSNRFGIDIYFDRDYNLGKDRIHSKRWYNQLNKKYKKMFANKIFKVEKQCFQYIRNKFPNAKCAYHNYWIDYLLDKIRRPHMASNYISLGKYVESLGFVNLGTIIDKPKKIPGAYDKFGDILLDFDKLYKHGYVLGPNDYHPGPEHQKIVSNKITKWIENVKNT